MIDHQLEYRDGNLRLDGIDAAVEENSKLLAADRAAGTAVIRIVTYGPPGSPIFDPTGPFAAIIPELAPPRDGEPVIEKKFPSSFHGTTLAEAVRVTGRRSLVITGFMTHMCVSTTVRAAPDHGFDCTVVSGATAARDLPDPFEGVIPAAEVQRSALAELADTFAPVVGGTASLGWENGRQCYSETA